MDFPEFAVFDRLGEIDPAKSGRSHAAPQQFHHNCSPADHGSEDQLLPTCVIPDFRLY
jgi:hypothetical protein